MYDDILELLRRTHSEDDGPISGASEGELDSLEARIGRPLPDSLRSWLCLCRSSTAGEGGVYGISSSHKYLNIDAVLDLYPSWRSLGWIPVAGDGCGNEYVMLRHDGRDVVAFIEAVVEVDEIAYVTATSLEIFLREMLLDEECETGWPFEREYVQEVDPELLQVSQNACDVD